MRECLILVEGIADKTFIRQYIRHVFRGRGGGRFDANRWIKECKGKDRLWEAQTIIEIRKANANGIPCLVIFDADDDYSSRREEILDKMRQHRIHFELFLFPNHQDDGDLETLLERIILAENKPIFDCWERYEKCLREVATPRMQRPLTIPARKTKIYAYLEALLPHTKQHKFKIKESHRDYRNRQHWDLSASPLQPLRKFLLRHLK